MITASRRLLIEVCYVRRIIPFPPYLLDLDWFYDQLLLFSPILIPPIHQGSL